MTNQKNGHALTRLFPHQLSTPIAALRDELSNSAFVVLRENFLFGEDTQQAAFVATFFASLNECLANMEPQKCLNDYYDEKLGALIENDFFTKKFLSYSDVDELQTAGEWLQKINDGAIDTERVCSFFSHYRKFVDYRIMGEKMNS